jgi:perosamine synthetase
MLRNFCMTNANDIVVPYWRTTFTNGEVSAISDAISNEHVSQGPVVAEFERQLAAYLGMPYAVATTSGSMALLMSLLAANVGPGDEVIVPNRTWIATAHAPFLLGAKVVLVDVEPGRPIIDANLIERFITKKTKVIMPVHMCGRSADMRAINEVARRNKLVVIEDAAQALGSKNADGYLGTQSNMGCFSFSVAKIISTGQGGFVTTRCEETYKRLIALRTQGVGDVINASWTIPGFNFRFTDVLAAIGKVQLGLLSRRIERVKEIYKMYALGLKESASTKIIPVNLDDGEVPIYVEALCTDRLELINFLAARGIQCRPFYPDLNNAGYLSNFGSYPNSKPFGLNGVYLPAGPDQSLSNIQLVIETILAYESQKTN